MRLLPAVVVATLFAASSPALATPTKGTTVEVKVTGDGWVPDRIPAKVGEPLTLVITRTTDRTCATEIVVKDYKINTKLPLNKAVTVKFTPTRTGEVKFACGMDMITGVIVVQ